MRSFGNKTQNISWFVSGTWIQNNLFMYNLHLNLIIFGPVLPKKQSQKYENNTIFTGFVLFRFFFFLKCNFVIYKAFFFLFFSW